MTTAQINSFDVDTLNADIEQVTFDVPVIFNADGEPETGFKIVGKNSPEYQAAQNAARIEGIKKAGSRKAPLDTSTDAGAETYSRQLSGVESRLALAVVVGWFGVTKDGVDLPFDIDMVKAIFKKYPTWREKVSAALENDANFIKG